MNINELSWAAGLFEGEGCIPRTSAIRLELGMNDEDTVRRFQTAIGRGSVSGPHMRSPLAKHPHYRWTLEGFESVQAVIAMLWPGLGIRRKATAREVLAVWRNRPVGHKNGPIDFTLGVSV